MGKRRPRHFDRMKFGMTSPPPVPKSVGRRHCILAVSLICLGFGIRLYSAATVPLNLDEMRWVLLAREVSFLPGELHLPIHGDQHPAGALYLAHLGTLVWGWTRLGVRLAHVALNAATLPLLYGFARAHLGNREALWTLALAALNPFHIGFARTVASEQYLFFQCAAMIFFWRAVTSARGIFMVGTGLALGMALFLKETPLLLVPIFAGYLAWTGRLRHWLGRRSTYLALAGMGLFTAPDLYFNLTNTQQTTEGFINYSYWLDRLRPLSPSIRPLSMYLPILFFKIQNTEAVTFEEYAFMDNVSGAMILLGVGYAFAVHRRRPVVAFLLSIFLPVFCFFSFFTDPSRAEFWWASPTFLPGVLCGGMLLARLTEKGWARWPFTFLLGLWLFLGALSSATQPTAEFTGRYMIPIQRLLSHLKCSPASMDRPWEVPLP